MLFMFVCQAALSSKNILQVGFQTFLFADLAKCDKQVKELDLSEFSMLNDQDLKTITAHCPNLQKLILKSTHKPNWVLNIFKP